MFVKSQAGTRLHVGDSAPAEPRKNIELDHPHPERMDLIMISGSRNQSLLLSPIATMRFPRHDLG